MIRFLLFLLALASPAGAQTARVLSGEHGDFTRLVIELPEAGSWTVGRTAMGYAFAADGTDQPGYDLTGVWQRIARTRLQSLQVSAETGALELRLACDCHVFPFEYRPGVIVLDIKPGAAPPASAFEAGFAMSGISLAESHVAESGAGYDWLAESRGATPPRATGRLPMPLGTGAVSLEPLRDELLEQISRGAADGVVEMELPGKPPEYAAKDHEGLPWSHIRVGEQPGVAVTVPNIFEDGTVAMADCAPDAFLDLASWSDGKPPHELLAEARSGLYGEFDLAEPKAVLRSVRQHLYLGFGAEAAQQADLLDVGAAPEDLAFLRSMALVLDGESDPGTPFAAMLSCDGSAALWAALARDRLPAGSEVNRDAILRGFLALPAHLRGHLGGTLAEKFLAHDDVEAARVISNAMERTPESDPAQVALLDANVGLHAGDNDGAQSHAEEAVKLDGNGTAAQVALVEAHFRKLEPISPAIAEALIAGREELGENPEAAAVDRAIILSLALSGQTEAAFAHAAASGDASGDLWQVVQNRATDDDFLRHAVLPGKAHAPVVGPEASLAIAERLLALGFADASLVWLGAIGPEDAEGRRLLAARAELGRGDARVAVGHLEGLAGPDAEAIHVAALLQLGDVEAASASLAAAGKGEEAARLELWQGDWAALGPDAGEAWLQTANLLGPGEPLAETGLLARGGATIESSLTARAAIETLLTTVPAPKMD